jgi:hypothetical protein
MDGIYFLYVKVLNGTSNNLSLIITGPFTPEFPIKFYVVLLRKPYLLILSSVQIGCKYL